jgi:hypothetical protein
VCTPGVFSGIELDGRSVLLCEVVRVLQASKGGGMMMSEGLLWRFGSQLRWWLVVCTSWFRWVFRCPKSKKLTAKLGIGGKSANLSQRRTPQEVSPQTAAYNYSLISIVNLSCVRLIHTTGGSYAKLLTARWVFNTMSSWCAKQSTKYCIGSAPAGAKRQSWRMHGQDRDSVADNSYSTRRCPQPCPR